MSNLTPAAGRHRAECRGMRPLHDDAVMQGDEVKRQPGGMLRHDPALPDICMGHAPPADSVLPGRTDPADLAAADSRRTARQALLAWRRKRQPEKPAGKAGSDQGCQQFAKRLMQHRVGGRSLGGWLASQRVAQALQFDPAAREAVHGQPRVGAARTCEASSVDRPDRIDNALAQARRTPPAPMMGARFSSVASASPCFRTMPTTPWRSSPWPTPACIDPSGVGAPASRSTQGVWRTTWRKGARREPPPTDHRAAAGHRPRRTRCARQLGPGGAAA